MLRLLPRLRLLPDDCETGWTRYAWLIYAVPFALNPLLAREPLPSLLLVEAGVVAFLLLYFAAHWVEGGRLALCVAGLVALGAGFSPWRPEALSFFIYAGSLWPRLGRPRWFWPGLLSISAAPVAEGLLVHLPPGLWGGAAALTLMLGAVTQHFIERGRLDQKLRLAQDEIARLAQLAERERIARDLHDLLGHTLSLVALKAELAAKLVTRDPARAEDELRQVEQVAREALLQVREAVTGYRSRGLSAELAEAKRALATAGVELTCEVARVALAPAEEAVLALAVREAVTNVIRHARANTCRITLSASLDARRLQVADDGRGGGGPDGAGLSGMRERVEALGGRLRREREGGTRLVVELPSSPPLRAVS